MGFSSSSQFIQTLISSLDVLGLNSNNKAKILLYDAVICDVAWKIRNQVQFEGLSPKLDGIMLKISKFVGKFRKVLDLTMGPTSNRVYSAWSKLNRDSVKIYVDAACNLESSSITVVARDWRGEVVFACFERVNTMLPFQAEVEAIKWALNLASNLDVDSIVIESDSKSYIDALRFPNLDVP